MIITESDFDRKNEIIVECLICHKLLNKEQLTYETYSFYKIYKCPKCDNIYLLKKEVKKNNI